MAWLLNLDCLSCCLYRWHSDVVYAQQAAEFHQFWLGSICRHCCVVPFIACYTFWTKQHHFICENWVTVWPLHGSAIASLGRVEWPSRLYRHYMWLQLHGVRTLLSVQLQIEDVHTVYIPTVAPRSIRFWRHHTEQPHFWHRSKYKIENCSWLFISNAHHPIKPISIPIVVQMRNAATIPYLKLTGPTLPHWHCWLVWCLWVMLKATMHLFCRPASNLDCTKPGVRAAENKNIIVCSTSIPWSNIYTEHNTGQICPPWCYIITHCTNKKQLWFGRFLIRPQPSQPLAATLWRFQLLYNVSSES